MGESQYRIIEVYLSGFCVMRLIMGKGVYKNVIMRHTRGEGLKTGKKASYDL